MRKNENDAGEVAGVLEKEKNTHTAHGGNRKEKRKESFLKSYRIVVPAIQAAPVVGSRLWISGSRYFKFHAQLEPELEPRTIEVRLPRGDEHEYERAGVLFNLAILISVYTVLFSVSRFWLNLSCTCSMAMASL